MLTLAESRALLSRYPGANNSYTDRLNLVCARLIPSGNWRLTKQRVVFNVYPDASNRAFITLLRQFNTVLAGAALYDLGTGLNNYGLPVPVQNGWFSYSPAGSGLNLDSRYNWSEGFNPEEGRFTTFADWTTAKMLRFKFDTTEANGTIIVRGTLAGSVIRSGAGALNIEGISVAYTGATVTTSQTFDTPPYQIVKPVTHENIDAMVVRLPGGTLWAFALQEPYGHCSLQYISDVRELAAKYSFLGAHPMIVNPCNATIYDPMKISSDSNVWSRGQIVQC